MLFRQYFNYQLIFIIILIFLGCTEKTTDCTVDIEIDGKYQIVFYDTQKTITNGIFANFNRSILADIKNADIKKQQNIKEIRRVDNLKNLTFNLNSDSINHVYNIKSTFIIDSVISNDSKSIYKNGEINHTAIAHSDHEITEIIDYSDTVIWTTSTNLNFKLTGQVDGKSNDLLLYYLIKKEISENYIPIVLNAIKDKKQISLP